MPDDPALAAAFGVALFHLLDDRLDAEELLMAGDLTLTVVEEGERTGQFQDALLATEGVKDTVLFGDCDDPCSTKLFVGLTGAGEVTRKEVLQLCVGKRTIDEAADSSVVMMLAPLQPELTAGADGGVEGLIALHRQQELDRMEQRGDGGRGLVGDELAHALHDLDTRSLVFDDPERDAVHQENDIAAARAFAVVTVDRELRGGLE